MVSVSSVAPVLDPSSRWLVIYPNYIDASKNIAQGRRIGKAHAVESPSLQEISAALSALSIPHKPEPSKCYPRDWLVEGRVRVQPEGINKKSLLLNIAKTVQQSRPPIPLQEKAKTKKK